MRLRIISRETMRYLGPTIEAAVILAFVFAMMKGCEWVHV